MKIVEKLLRAGEGRTLKRLDNIAAQVNAIEEDFEKLTDAELRGETDKFKARLADGETLDDPVAWVNVGFHHINRDEDQSPMPIHWQGFTLYPRDFAAQAPNIPEGRKWVNGDMRGVPNPNITPTPTATPTTRARSGSRWSRVSATA